MSFYHSIRIPVHALVVFMSISCARRDPYLSASLLKWTANDTQFCHHHRLLPHVYIHLLYKHLILCQQTYSDDHSFLPPELVVILNSTIIIGDRREHCNNRESCNYSYYNGEILGLFVTIFFRLHYYQLLFRWLKVLRQVHWGRSKECM